MVNFRSRLCIYICAPLMVVSACSLTGGQEKSAKTIAPLIAVTPPAAWASSLPEADTVAADAAVSWITQFGSDALAHLTDQAIDTNFSLTAIEARMRAARESVAASRALGRPQLGTSVSGGQQLTSLPNAAGNRQQDWSQFFQLGVTASWEADIWGRISARTGAALADLAASQAELVGARLLLTAQVASNWINLSNAKAQKALAQDQLRVRARSRQLTERRFATGLSTALDVRLARSAEATALAEIADAERILASLTGSLQALIGLYPSGQFNTLAATMDLKQLPSMADIADPTAILIQRTDIVAAEARLRAAGLRAKAARAAVLPSLAVDASFGTSSDDVARLFDVSYIAGRILANLTAPIYSGGQIAADKRRTLALAEAAAADYTQTVLNAWREVENTRTAEIRLAEVEAAYSGALTESRAAESLAERQYQNGLISIFNLLDAQTLRISSERALNATRAARYLNRVEYHLALGGDA